MDKVIDERWKEIFDTARPHPGKRIPVLPVLWYCSMTSYNEYHSEYISSLPDDNPLSSLYITSSYWSATAIIESDNQPTELAFRAHVQHEIGVKIPERAVCECCGQEMPLCK